MTNSCWTVWPLGDDSCRLREPVQNWHAAPISIAERDEKAISQLASWISAIFPHTALISMQPHLISPDSILWFCSILIWIHQLPADWPTCKYTSLSSAWHMGERKGLVAFAACPRDQVAQVGTWLKYCEIIRPQPGRGQTQPTSYCSFHLKLCAREGNYASLQRPGETSAVLWIEAPEIKGDRRLWNIPRRGGQTSRILS